MANLLWGMILLVGCAQSQSTSPAASANRNAQAPPTAASVDDMPTTELAGQTGLVRGVLKKTDPIHDQLIVRAFGGGDIRINFDGRTQLLPDAHARLTSLPAGSVVSVDTVIDHGKLFARSVRSGGDRRVEMSGQIVRYDPAKNELALRDPLSPQNVSLHVNANTKVVNKGQSVSATALSSGMLVRVWFTAAQNTANEIEILAERGGSFTFQGRVVSVDLRSRVVALSNDTDQSLRELSFNSLDPANVRLLHEGAEVNIQAEFDGDRYNVRTVTPLERNP
jgi:hypothetical protein